MRTYRSLIAKAAAAGMLLAAGIGAQEPAIAADIDTAPEAVASRETPSTKTSAFTIHPILSLAVSGLHVSYEIALGGGRTALEIPAYLGYNERVYDNPMLFLGSGLGIRRYLTEAGKGTYICPQIEIVNIHRFERGPDSVGNIVVVAPSVRMGYKWRWEIFTMELGAGAAFISANATTGKWNEDEEMSVLIPMGHFALGIPF
jgi:hypothetical protein